MITQSDLQGHWQRDWIKAPGFEDHTTRVHWMQAGALFADLRIPLVRPNVQDLSCLGDLPLPALKPLLAAEGFAGQIGVENSQCTWHRRVNWQGVPGQPDVGLMSFDAQGGLIEDGVHAEYRELWQQMPQPQLRAVAVRSDEMTGVLIENDDVFLLGIGPHPEGSSEALQMALDDGTAQAADLCRQFESAYVMGTWDGPLGIARLSTNPLHEGQVALERNAGFTWHALAFDGRKTARRLTVE